VERNTVGFIFFGQVFSKGFRNGDCRFEKTQKNNLKNQECEECFVCLVASLVQGHVAFVRFHLVGLSLKERGEVFALGRRSGTQ